MLYDMLIKLLPLDLGDEFKEELGVDSVFIQEFIAETLTCINEFMANTANNTLSLWESDWGLSNAEKALVERQHLLVAALRAKGGINKQHFINLAAGLGYTITITIGGSPFRSGISRAGDPVYSQGSMWTWFVHVQDVPSAPSLEHLFNDLKPPYSKIDFVYTA